MHKNQQSKQSQYTLHNKAGLWLQKQISAFRSGDTCNHLTESNTLAVSFMSGVAVLARGKN